MQPETELRLPAESIAPALARAGVRGACPGVPGRTEADLALLVTELVANAVKHGTRGHGDEIIVRLFAAEVIRVEVVDRGPGFDAGAPAQPKDGRASGWGLYLLDSLATRWGVERDRETTMVWFELERAVEAGGEQRNRDRPS